MKNKPFPAVFIFLGNCLLANTILLISSFIIHNTYSLIVLLFIVDFVLLLLLLRSNLVIVPNVAKRFLSFFIYLFYICSGVFIIAAIIITPFPVYVSWIQLINEGSDGGSISYLFICYLSFFVTLFCGLSYTSGIIKPFAGLALTVTVLMSIIFYTMILIFLSVILLLVNIVFLVSSFKTQENRRAVILSAIIQILLIFFVSFLFSFSSPLYKGWLGELRLLPQTYSFIKTVFPVSPFVTSIGSYDAAENMNVLGEKPYDKKPVLKIKGTPGKTFYIRMEAFATYTGASWQHEKEYLTPTDLEIVQFNNNDADINTVKITLLADYCYLVPHTLDTISININLSENRELIYSDFDTCFALTLPFIRNDVVNIKQSPEKLPRKSNPDDSYFTHYLHVPLNTEKALIEIAEDINKDTKNIDRMCKNIYTYLSGNYYYSLDTPGPVQYEDFVLDFLLKQNKGFCQHFASAFVILARLSGIPSRYVSGYLVYMPTDAAEVICTGLSAHAWPEIWDSEKGWIIYEATPPMNPEIWNSPDFYTLHNRDKDKKTTNQLVQIFGNRIEFSKETGNINKKTNIFLVSFIMTIGLTFLIGIIVISRFFRKQRSQLTGNNKKIQKIIGKIVKKAQKQMISHPMVSGWIVWVEEIKKKYNINPVYIRRVLSIILMTFFSSKTPGNFEVRYIQGFSKKINRTIVSR